MLVVLPGRLSNRVGIGVFILASFKLESHISHVLRPGPFSYVHTLHLNHLGSLRCCSQARHWLDLRGFLRVHLEQAQYSPFLRVPFSRDFSLEPPHAWHMDTCPGFSRVHLLHIQSLLSASTSSFESSTWNIEKKDENYLITFFDDNKQFYGILARKKEQNNLIVCKKLVNRPAGEFLEALFCKMLLLERTNTHLIIMHKNSFKKRFWTVTHFQKAVNWKIDFCCCNCH